MRRDFEPENFPHPADRAENFGILLNKAARTGRLGCSFGDDPPKRTTIGSGVPPQQRRNLSPPAVRSSAFVHSRTTCIMRKLVRAPQHVGGTCWPPGTANCGEEHKGISSASLFSPGG